MFADIPYTPAIVPSEAPAEQTLAYAGSAIGSGTTETTEAPLPPIALGLTEAQHMAQLLRAMDALVAKHSARLGLSREELRAGKKPEPAVDVTVDERHAVGDALHGFRDLVEKIGDADQDAILPYVEQEVLLALSVLDRGIDAEELHLWLRPEAQEILQPADCTAALERLVARNAIRTRTLIVGAGASEMRFGDRVLRFDGCGALLRIYAAPFQAPTLKII